VIDVTSLEINKTIHIGEIKAPEGVEIMGDKNIPVVSVAVPRAEEEAAPAEGAAAAAGDVEMIKEKKEGEEEGAAPAAKGAEKGAAAAKGAAPEKGAAAPAAGDKKAAAAPAEKKK